MTDSTTLAAQWQKDADRPHPPTEFTLAYRQAMQGEGPQAYQWKDKPHRLVFDLCRHIETTDQRCAELEAENARLREAGQAVIDTAFDHYTARNGRRVSIEGNDGEKCWIVPFDPFEDLRKALGAAAMADDPFMTNEDFDAAHDLLDKSGQTAALPPELLERVAKAVNEVKVGLNYDYLDFCRDVARAVAPGLIAHGRKLEEAEVVAWLRTPREPDVSSCEYIEDYAIVRGASAFGNAIERKEHRSKP